MGIELVQLPPSLYFEQKVAEQFFSVLREHYDGQVVYEPRHPSWFDPMPSQLLKAFHVARVAADPAPVPQANESGGWGGLVYYWLHGSPSIYRPAYSAEYLGRLSSKMQWNIEQSTTTWCVFHNTAEGAATGNALELNARLK